MSRYVKMLPPIQPQDLVDGGPFMVPDRIENNQIVYKLAPPISQMSWVFSIIGGGKDGANPKLGKGTEIAERVYRLQMGFTDPMKRHEIDGAQYMEFEDTDHKAVADIIAEFAPSNALLWAQMRPFMHEWSPEKVQDDTWRKKQTVKAVGE